MRRLTMIVIGLAVIYSTYWFIGATQTERAMTTQLDDLATAGWKVDFTKLSTTGFPSRFDTSLTKIHLESPDRKTVWKAPFVQALSLSYKPNKIILALPDQQKLVHDGILFDIRSTGLLASLALAPTSAFELVTLTVETGPLTVSSLDNFVFFISKGIAALRLANPDQNQYDTYLDIEGFTLPDGVRDILDPAGTLPKDFAQMTIDGTVVFDNPLDTSAPTTQPRPTQISLKGMTITWGTLQLSGQGQVKVDSLGIPTGSITISAQNWRIMIEMAVEAGLLDQGIAKTAQNMAALLAGDNDELSVPIIFANGFMSLGPLPLGPAPQVF